jgi:hypothetical protein
VLQIRFAPGLPDGIFSNLKYQCGQISEDLAMEYFGILYGHLIYFMAIWYIMWPFGLFCGHLVYCVANWYILWLLHVYFLRFGMLYQEKSGNPALLCKKTGTKIVDFFSLPQQLKKIPLDFILVINHALIEIVCIRLKCCPFKNMRLQLLPGFQLFGNGNRVTRWGEFSPIGRSLLWSVF